MWPAAAVYLFQFLISLFLVNKNLKKVKNNMALFESYDRRIDHINAVLKEYGINGIEDAKAICDAKGIDPYTMCKETQPICFEKCLLGLRCRCCNRNQEGLHQRCRSC